MSQLSKCCQEKTEEICYESVTACSKCGMSLWRDEDFITDTTKEPESKTMSVEERYKRMKLGLRLELVPSICNDVEQIIEALIAERERLARINELEKSNKELGFSIPYGCYHDKRLRELQSPQEAEPGKSECQHEWVDMRNQAIRSGELCVKCNRVRPGKPEN